MTQKKRIGDPFEQIVTTGKIGGKQTSRSSELQMSESSEVQTSNVSEVQNTKSSEAKKAKHNGREQQTVYLPPHIVRKLKLYKAMHDIEYSDIVAKALEEYFNTHQ